MREKHSEYLARGLWNDERLGWVLDTAAGRWGQREFLRLGDARYSFAALNTWVNAVAQELIRLHVLPGDRVLIQAGNCVELLVLQFAAWRIGAVSVPVVPIYRTHEMKAILAQMRPTIVAAASAVGTRATYAEMDVLLGELGLSPRAKFILGQVQQRSAAVADQYRSLLVKLYGQQKGSAIKYAEAFEDMLGHTSTKEAPWFIVPPIGSGSAISSSRKSWPTRSTT